MSGDRREDLRRSLDQPCWIDAGPKQPPKNGRLNDVSKSGAKLTCEGSEQLPAEFFLYLTHDGKVGRRCQVVRRDGAELGLRFAKVGRLPKPGWLETGDVKIVES